jgi:CheY-like chemotaxis protein
MLGSTIHLFRWWPVSGEETIMTEKKEILIIDDDADGSLLLSILLDRRGYKTVISNNGREALIWLGDNKPDLVILDVMMPEMDGWETYRYIREKYDVSVIFLTASVAGESAARALQLGADDFIRKPYHNEELLARIESRVKGSKPVEISLPATWGRLINQRPSVSVIIPTLNEAENLPLVLPYFPPDWVDEIILVDGLSTDNTVDIAKRLLPSIRVIMESKPGKGNALQAGYRASTGDIIIVLDCDGSHDPREIPRYVTALVQGADFVKGSRFSPGGGTTDMPRYRQLGNGFFVVLVNILFRATFTDLCYGYHAFWRYCLNSIELLNANGFEIDTVLYLGALRDRLRISEVPSFEGYRFYGVGKLKTIPDGIRVLKSIVREWWKSKWPASQHDYIGFRGKPPDETSTLVRFDLHENEHP